MTPLNLTVVDTPFDPASFDKEINFRPVISETAAALYKIWLYLDGPDVFFVSRVTYTLHPTFKSPQRVVERSWTNQNCQLEIWTWGVFEVRALVECIDGRRFELRHQLEYPARFKEPGVQFKTVGVPTMATT